MKLTHDQLGQILRSFVGLSNYKSKRPIDFDVAVELVRRDIDNYEEQGDRLIVWYPYENDEQAVDEFKIWLETAKTNYGKDMEIGIDIGPLRDYPEIGNLL